MVIIGDNTDGDVTRILPIEQANDLINKIKIPSILINTKDSKKFEEVLSQSKGEGDDEKQIIIGIDFPLTKTSQKSSVKFILQADDYRSYESITKFSKYYNEFKDSMRLAITYKVYSRPSFFGQFNNMPVSDKNCLSVNGDRFCV